MPPKRPADSAPTTPKKLKSDPDPISPTTSSPKESWSDSEEQKFLEAIDKIVILNLWAELKGDDEVGKRGANGVRSHWDAMVSLLPFLLPSSYRHPFRGECMLMISIRRRRRGECLVSDGAISLDLKISLTAVSSVSHVNPS